MKPKAAEREPAKTGKPISLIKAAVADVERGSAIESLLVCLH